MIGIAVCTYRRPEGLERLLRALPAGCAPFAPPVLVIDNDGTDPAIAAIVARMPADARHVVEPRPGISAARNRAIAEARAAGITRLAMLDDDEWPAPGWLAALVARMAESGAVVVGGPVEPALPQTSRIAPRHRRFWAVRPQRRAGRPFVHATSNVLLDLARLADVPAPLFDDAFGLSGGGDLLCFSRLFRLGVPMAWAESALATEAIPPERATWAWLRRRRFRVGNHMVIDEVARQGATLPALKTAALLLRLPLYPLLGREAAAPFAGWWLEAAKLRGRIAAHLGLLAVEYARDGTTLRRARAPEPTAPAPVEAATVLVVIPALNEAAHIEDCVRSLLGGDPWMRDVAIVVADGGSTDGTPDRVRRLALAHPRLALTHNPRRTQAAGINLVALGDARHRYLVRCDAHATYPEGYVRCGVERLAGFGPDVAAVASVMDAGGTGGFARAAAWAIDTRLGSGGAPHRGGCRSGFVAHGHHAAFRLDWFRRVGGYDESFGANEDAELDHRLAIAGGRIWLDAGLRLRYRVRESLVTLTRQYFRYGRGRARMLRRHRLLPRPRQALPVLLFLALVASLALAPLAPWLLLAPAGYLALLALAALRCAGALRSVAGLWAGPALLALHNAWAAGFLRGACSPAPRPHARAASSATVATPGE